MKNAEKFLNEFGIYATELWAKPEKAFLEWLNADVPDTNVGDTISRQAALYTINEYISGFDAIDANFLDGLKTAEKLIKDLPSVQPEQRPLTEDDYAYCEECDPEVKCLSCGHRIAERPLEVYCNIMCKWVNEKDYCTMFEPGQRKMKKTEAQI